MRNKEEAKSLLISLKKIQNIVYWSTLTQIGFGFLNSWFYKLSDYNTIWIFIIALNVFFSFRGLMQYHRGYKIEWELENEINSN